MKLASALLVPLAALTLAACGSSEEQSSQQAAVNAICKARADMHDQVTTMSGMVRAPGTPQAVASSLSSIRDDVATIKGEVAGLAAQADQQRVAAANDTFNAAVQQHAADMNAESVTAWAPFTTAREQLAAAEKNIELPVNC
jgi:hypothetical protein